MKAFIAKQLSKKYKPIQETKELKMYKRVLKRCYKCIRRACKKGYDSIYFESYDWEAIRYINSILSNEGYRCDQIYYNPPYRMKHELYITWE